ncbi:MAG: class I SAM-dependent methyltransferase [Luminiphilus sp.]|jgi:MMP 1-O-methyltransferase|nr:class I SAM-dependent methyltransferase [Luminiphilus sp.]
MPPSVVPQPPSPNVTGFLADNEGRQLFDWGLDAAPLGPLLEVGSYCGRSTIWLAQAAREANSIVLALDHHRGSEEHQPGESYHDSDLLDTDGRFDSLHAFRRNIAGAGLEPSVIPIVSDSATFARHWSGDLGMVFIDGEHSLASALIDYRCWAPRVCAGGILAIHDVFPDPAEGGQAPFTIWRLAQESGLFQSLGAIGSLRGLRRVAC